MGNGDWGGGGGGRCGGVRGFACTQNTEKKN